MSEGGEGGGAGVCGQPSRLQPNLTSISPNRPTNGNQIISNHQPQLQVVSSASTSRNMTRIGSTNSTAASWSSVSCANNGFNETGSSLVPSLTSGSTVIPNLTNSLNQRTTNSSNMFLMGNTRKRPGGVVNSDDEPKCKRRKISEEMTLYRLKKKQRMLESLMELFYYEHNLTSPVNELYEVWRKKPSTPALLNYLRNNLIDASDLKELLAMGNSVQEQLQLPEMKIAGGAGASVTPVAVSTTLPAAVARLSQQGQLPGRPIGGRHGMVFASRQGTQCTTTATCTTPLSQILPLVPGGTPLDPNVSIPSNVPDKRLSSSPNKQKTQSSSSRQPSISAVYDTSIGSQEQIVEKAKQEAHVIQRIGELQREGLWAEKRLPKVHEPARAKAHWDYLLEEMVWLAADFAQERKWKKAAAKKCARMVQKHFQEKEQMAQKAVKSKEMQLKRIAGCMAKEIKQFWANVEKLVEYKQQTRLEEKRKKALDQHLSFIVDQTEKYSTLVAESMNKTGAESVSQSLCSSRAPSPTRHSSDIEFEPGGSSSDDEETIAKEEAEEVEGEADHSAEIEMLQKESELPLDELLKDYLDNRENIIVDEPSSQDDEFHASGESSDDDEETIKEQETAEGKIDYKQELVDLEMEGQMSLDELVAKYGAREETVIKEEPLSEVEDEQMETSQNGEDESMDVEDEDEEEEDIEEDPSDAEVGTDLSLLLNEDSTFPVQPEGNEATDKEINDVAALAESIQPTGNTLTTTSVGTKIPFLLKHTLREYQHIGLDWLVTMYDRKLNGILADEMGLGKTIQTISVLAHLACEKGNWGPHLIIVPTSVMLNWEMEFMKWCPAFKILTYYGSQKERRMKRTGWTKPNAFHVCITSYKLVIQDHQSFRRKKWKYLILDEAQNIKNFKSQRWQLLLNFQTQRRLLLTGTPLQNNLMELWSLMHFLMPNVFQSHREFKEWFSNPVTGMIEGNSEYNEQIIKRLHKVLRPFLLRRLKTEVEKQLPKKYEHIIMCRLSNRQRYLYDDFMSRAKTRETLASGNMMSVINVLMQLRKVCNHPNLFEVRPTVSPFQMEAVKFYTASLVWCALDYNPFKHVNLSSLNLDILNLDMNITAYTAHRMRKYRLNNRLIEEIDSTPPIPRCPAGKIRIHVKFTSQHNTQTQVAIRPGTLQTPTNNRPAVIATTTSATPKVGTSPLVRTAIIGQTPTQGLTLRVPCGTGPAGQVQSYSVQLVQHQGAMKAIPVAALGAPQPAGSSGEGTSTGLHRISVPTGFAQLVQTTTGRHLLFTSSPQVLPGPGTPTVMTSSGQRLTVLGSGVAMTTVTGALTRLTTPAVAQLAGARPIMRMPPLTTTSIAQVAGTSTTQSPSIMVACTTSSVPSNFVTTMASSTVTTTVTVTTTTTATTVKTCNTVTQPVVSTTSSPSPLPITSISSGASSITTRAASVQAKKKQDEKDAANAFIMPSLEEKRKLQRRDKLRKIGEINTRRCTACPMYGMDLVQSMRFLDEIPSENDERLDNWMCSGHLHCYHAHNPDPQLYWHQTNALSNAIISIEQRLNELKTILSKFVVCVPAVNAPQPKFHVSHPPPWKLWQYKCDEATLHKEVSQRAGSLHPIISSMMTQFPDPRLIQYDCGKLQALDKLLRKLKSGGHRVLIFTQMTRMLDVLEAFLNHHGHIYLRLDGTTRVDQRQALMERFNADKRIFCFILSTRSGGVGVNLTGADTVIFYDSDWNPTMDAQAQDRCHRIGQTRDVHIYRLISEKTVEENILKKANQKRMLGDLAIEGGNFTTAYFKSSIIQDLFDVNVNENDASTRMAEVLNRDTERRHNGEEVQIIPSIGEEKSALGVLESALAAAEDETDVVAAKTAKAEAVADLEEFDESIPLDQDVEVTEDISRAEQEVNALVQQLSAVERYAMRFIEETDTIFSAEQLAAAEAEIEQQKLEWEKERLQALYLEEERQAQLAEDASEELLTFTREDSTNQIWVSENGQDQMPMWCPPTPPQDDSDIYIDHALAFLYEPTIMSEALLPSVYVKKDRKRSRIDSPGEGRHPMKVGAYHREETPLIHAPKSLFDRPSPALVKMRHDLRLQKYRGGARPPVTPPGLKQVPLNKPPPEPEHVPEWLIHEDCALLQAVQAIQELLLNLMIVSPGHTPNWEMVADMVNMVSRIYRSPKQCKNRYESVIIPREEGKILESNPKKQKKTKGVYKMPQTKSNRPMRTAQLYTQDNNISYSQLMNSRFESIRIISNKRTPTVKPFLNNPEVKNPKHAEVLAGCGINYDSPLSPVDVAQRRADRIAKDKLAAAANYEQQLAFLRGQVGTGAAGTSAVAGNSTVTSPSTTPNTSSQRPGTTLTVQEVVNVGSQVVSRTINSPVSSTSPQRVVTANITAVSQSPTTMATKVMTTGKLSTAHIQVYQHRQAILRQQQLKALQSRAAAAAVASGQKVSVAVTGVTAAQHQARMQQQVKQGGVTRAVTEAEMAAILKRQALVAHNSSAGKAGVSTATTSLTPAQILAQAGLQAQQPGQIATLVKTVPGQTHIPVTGLTIPQVKAALGPGIKTATPQQIRQLTLQQQLLAQRKLPAQKVAQLGQVMVTNKPGVPAQLIVQSQKSAPSTMTMQQIQQVIKHVHPQHIAHMSASGQTVVTQSTSGQVISHAVLAKAQQASGSAQARVIPVSSQQNLKQTIQVVTASPGVRTSVPNVTIDSAGRPSVSVASALAGAIKVGTSAQQQALLSQVSAALQQGQQISVRQNPVRIQAAPSGTPLVAVAVSQAPTLLTLPQQSTDNVGTSWSYVTHNKVTNPRQSPTQNQ